MFNKKPISKIAHEVGASDSGNRFGGAGFQDFISPSGLEKWKPSAGPNKIDIIPYNAGKTHPLVVTGQAEEGDGLYSLDVYVHKDIGPSHRNIPCLRQFGKNCPLCNESNRLRNLGTDEGKQASTALYARRRVVYLVHDLNNNKFGYWDTGYKSVEQKINAAAAFEMDDATGEKVDIHDWENGRTIRFLGNEQTFNGHKFVEPDAFGFLPRKPLSEDVLSHSTDLSASLNMMSEEDMEKLLAGEVVQNQASSSAQTEQPSAAPVVERDAVEDPQSAPAPAPKKEAAASENVCPCGHKWGEADKHSECATCQVWEKCIG